MEIDTQNLIELLNQVKEVRKANEKFADSVSDILDRLSVQSEAVDNLYDDLILLITTQSPEHASSHPAQQSPGPAQGPDQEKAGSQDKETRRSDPS